jgi:hypothetical protein
MPASLEPQPPKSMRPQASGLVLNGSIQHDGARPLEARLSECPRL